MRSVRVTFVVTRSVQYYAPWFRHIAACCDELDLAVVDATEATAIRQGMGRVIADTRPDVVVVNGWYSMTLVRALFACRRLGVPTLWRGDTHAGDAPRGWQRFLWRLKTRWLLNRFDGYLSPGSRVRAVPLEFWRG